MANLTSFVYCLNAERVAGSEGNGDAINAMGILSTMTPEFVPGAFSFSIIFAILDVDITAENKIQITFKNSEGKELVDSGNILIPGNKESKGSTLPKEYQGLNMSMDFRNVVFESEGVYTTEVSFNDTLLGVMPIYVKGKRSC